MALTTAQQATLKAAILADPVLDAFPNTLDGAFGISVELNKQFSPDFTVWKTDVSVIKIGDNFDGAELANLTTAEANRLQTIAAYSVSGFSEEGINPSLIDRRLFFDDVFSGAQGATTRANLAALWRRIATYGEKIFASGTGTNASPALLDIEGNISYPDVFVARNS